MEVKAVVDRRLHTRARLWQAWLAAAGGCMTLLYLLFAVGYPLVRYYDVFIPVSHQTKPLFSLAERGIIVFDTWVYLVAVIAIHVLFLSVFGVLLRRAWSDRAENSGITTPVVLGVSAVSAIFLLASYPLFSQDVFDYLFQTREWVVYAANPYINVPDNFRFDPLYKYVSWTQAPNAYGPLWILITAPLSLFAGDNLLMNVLLYKGLAVVAFLGTAWLIYSTLGRIAPRYQMAGTVLFAWNPIMLIEFAGSGHNDAVMLFFVALAVWFVSRGRLALSLIALLAGGLIKVVPILLMPFFVIYIWRRLHTGEKSATNGADGIARARGFLYRRPALYLGVALFACLILAVAAYLPFWAGPAALSFLNRGDMIAGAVIFTHVQEVLLTLGLEMGLVLLFIKGAAYLGFGIFCIRQAWALAIGSPHTFFHFRPVRALGSKIRGAVGEPRLARVSAQWWSREEPPPGSTEGDLRRLLRVCMGVLVFFTLYSSLYYQPWYLTWSLLFLPFLLSPRYKWHVLSLIVVSVVTTLGFVYF